MAGDGVAGVGSGSGRERPPTTGAGEGNQPHDFYPDGGALLQALEAGEASRGMGLPLTRVREEGRIFAEGLRGVVAVSSARAQLRSRATFQRNSGVGNRKSCETSTVSKVNCDW